MILVGLPLLGLLVVIERGKAISPPIAVSGDWQAKLEEVPEPDSCLGRRLSPFFSIQMIQSGPQLTVLLKEGASAELRGRISNSHISARAEDRSLEFAAEVQKRKDGDRLVGFVTMAECPESGRIHFWAARSLQDRTPPARDH